MAKIIWVSHFLGIQLGPSWRIWFSEDYCKNYEHHDEHGFY